MKRNLRSNFCDYLSGVTAHPYDTLEERFNYTQLFAGKRRAYSAEIFADCRFMRFMSMFYGFDAALF